jgi:hypothetical protein
MWCIGRQNVFASPEVTTWTQPLNARGLQPRWKAASIVAQMYNPDPASLLPLAECLIRSEMTPVGRTADLALGACGEELQQGERNHTFIFVPHLFQHIGVVTGHDCSKFQGKCGNLRVSRRFLDEEVARVGEGVGGDKLMTVQNVLDGALAAGM